MAGYGLPYQPYYCEENVRRLLDTSGIEVDRSSVVVISNKVEACPFWRQRAAPSPDRPVFWDYHVIAVEWGDGSYRVWDLESRLETPVDFPIWFRGTFPALDQFPRRFQPRFRIVPAPEYIRVFSSDRSHMRDDEGAFVEPPPDWEPILQAERGMNLDRFIDMTSEFVGDVVATSEFRRRFDFEDRSQL